MALREGEVVVNVDDNSSGCSKEIIEVNKISSECSFNKY
jgi:hypothetical protein